MHLASFQGPNMSSLTSIEVLEALFWLLLTNIKMTPSGWVSWPMDPPKSSSWILTPFWLKFKRLSALKRSYKWVYLNEYWELDNTEVMKVNQLYVIYSNPMRNGHFGVKGRTPSLAQTPVQADLPEHLVPSYNTT